MEDNMYIPDCIPERHLKNLEGDCIRIYLYRLMFGEKIQAASIATALNLEVEIVEHCIEKLILLLRYRSGRLACDLYFALSL